MFWLAWECCPLWRCWSGAIALRSNAMWRSRTAASTGTWSTSYGSSCSLYFTSQLERSRHERANLGLKSPPDRASKREDLRCGVAGIGCSNPAARIAQSLRDTGCGVGTTHHLATQSRPCFLLLHAPEVRGSPSEVHHVGSARHAVGLLRAALLRYRLCVRM